MEKLLKENLSYILIAVILFVAGVYGIWANGGIVINNINDMSSKKAELETKKTTLDMLIAKQKAKAQQKKLERQKKAAEHQKKVDTKKKQLKDLFTIN